jgi:putative component of toxin-antitoxin plasmid stabilization module
LSTIRIVDGVKGVGSGVQEYRIDFGPGYRIYFGKDGDRLVILLGGGTKRRQQNALALARWTDYKKRKNKKNQKKAAWQPERKLKSHGRRHA